MYIIRGNDDDDDDDPWWRWIEYHTVMRLQLIMTEMKSTFLLTFCIPLGHICHL